MTKFVGYRAWLTEKATAELFNPVKRGKQYKFSPQQHPELAPELYDLITTAYAELGGHLKIKDPSDVVKNTEWNYWEGTDIHGTPDFDIIMFGQKTPYGVKFSGVGHDGEKDSKRAYLDQRGKDLKKPGFFLECSGKLAEILINKYGCPTVDDPEEVKKIIPTMSKWIGEYPEHSGKGWYERPIGGQVHKKIVVGRPKNV